MEVYADGGVLKGTDIFKMLALGADYVFIGRGILYSIVEGYEGVKKALNIYESELKTAMMLCGTRNVQEINETYLAELKNPRPRL
jgi:isopentenyl diphosphate isomerase/L-lactate dehydrogenase-like FMN-dependent dehydrogenase